MRNKIFVSVFWLCLGIGLCMTLALDAQEPVNSHIRVVVDLVQLNVAVTDSRGNYVTGLQPSDFVVMEDGIPQKVSTFAEGNGPAHRLADAPQNAKNENDTQQTDHPQDGVRVTAAELSSVTAGANVFVLFDTSDYMYRGFVFAQDAISDFVRSLESADRIAFYSYSRDLSRAALLTSDRSVVLRGVRTTVAGDDAALYNCLLLTLKDAGQFTGRKVVVVFSNGPDNASVVPPEDVAELAQSTGTAIYMICTREAQLEPISTAVFERMTAATGGKAYFAKSWKEERRAFASIREDLAHLYSLSYYPQPNPNRGWRSITVKLNSDRLKRCHVRTRNGYRLQPTRFAKADIGVEADPR
ncbi:MAG TPA: VWA domain-containing protein [Candidatus Acidoferrum sp.]